MSAVVNVHIFTWRGFGLFVFLRGAFRYVLQGLCFPIRQHTQQLTTPPFGQTAQETQWRLIKRHERHSFGDNSAYPVCFSFKQAICLYTGWIAGLEGQLSTDATGGFCSCVPGLSLPSHSASATVAQVDAVPQTLVAVSSAQSIVTLKMT